MECNPDAIDAGKLATYARAGVNRLSFGVQSMVGPVLQALGRTHDPENVERAVRLARDAGFARLNLDLIYGSPAESPADWQTSLAGALALEPEHISAYALTIEAGTPLGQAIAAGEKAAPDDDRQADAYLVRRRHARARPGSSGTRSRTGRGPERRAGTTSSTGARVRISASAARRTATPTVAAGGTCAHPSATSPRSRRARAPKRVRRRCRPSDVPKNGSRSRCAPVAERRLPTRTPSWCRSSRRRVSCRVPDRASCSLPRGRLLASDLTARLLLAGAATAEGTGVRTDGVGTRYH